MPKLNWRSQVRALVRRVGLDIHRYHPDRSMDSRRAHIFDQLGISLVIDVGANVGQYGRRLRSSGYRGRIVSFEPVREAFQELESAARADTAWDCHRLALGATTETREIYISAKSESSSLLPLTEEALAAAPAYGCVGKEFVPTARLDGRESFLNLRSQEVAWLKIDVQGYELEVLRGAGNTLDQIQGIEVELSTVALYIGQPLFSEVLIFLEALGFRLAGIDPIFWDAASSHLLQMDGIFVRARPA